MQLRPRLNVIVLALSGVMSTSIPVSANEQGGTVALITDFHFNPFDPPELAGALALRPAGKWDEIFAKIENQKMSGWGSDTNYALFFSSIRAFADSLSAQIQNRSAADIRPFQRDYENCNRPDVNSSGNTV